uniref:Uncharacterized protein n=1 Tax=Lotus japonicus TaxID=34305 RepID=I3S1X0_LOTJA|nr:unknown [Lotus japonicus]AFK41586.1 unknown [Lotus japonicus]
MQHAIQAQYPLHIALFVKLGVKNLLATHCTNSFSVSTGVAVLAILVHLLLTNKALSFSVRGPSVLLGEELVLVDLAATTLSSIAGTFFPLVWYYHLG